MSLDRYFSTIYLVRCPVWFYFVPCSISLVLKFWLHPRFNASRSICWYDTYSSKSRFKVCGSIPRLALFCSIFNLSGSMALVPSHGVMFLDSYLGTKSDSMFLYSCPGSIFLGRCLRFGVFCLWFSFMINNSGSMYKTPKLVLYCIIYILYQWQKWSESIYILLIVHYHSEENSFWGLL